MSNDTRENEILLSALTKWGAGMQTVMVFEEMAEIRFLRGRLKFGGSKNSAPFPSMVVVFRGGGSP